MAERFDVVVVGGGPAGATAAWDLAREGTKVLLLDRGDRIKPCGGAIPPRAIADFEIPDDQLCAHIDAARCVAPSGRTVTMTIADSLPGAYVGMVDRAAFDPWLRERAASAGADLRHGRFEKLEELADGSLAVSYRTGRDAEPTIVEARYLIGADGARSEVARQALPKERSRYVFAYHEIVSARGPDAVAPDCCDVIYRGDLSPDFYSWVFPHGDTVSIGTGTARKGFSLKGAVAQLRDELGLTEDVVTTVRREGAPIPLKPLKHWDNGRNVLLVGDAAGVVAPASGEGIYYALTCGRMGAAAVATALATGDARHLAGVRRTFLAEHGKVFRVLGLLQACWYRSDWLRERFVALCKDADVQRLTWIAYTQKRMVKAQHAAHARLLLTNIANLVPGWWKRWRSSDAEQDNDITARAA
ncbi:geranylgeranyl diphosphate reductase [Erythrobacter sp. LQ02-29]|uniref:geranylgeranyl diphosphate reductase n=1 Tax=Erythrobacter sp. LQ02-29 TaxID=2920384 RepID=UPI001F4E9F13|nr:geranylgeranyl diphosphate reductase [Erythrobacter sp. LQ02-29]MCP9223825.1 geranylgeranyl diphosphate reductase [Erythrobacter sp. LQ02-29]